MIEIINVIHTIIWRFPWKRLNSFFFLLHRYHFLLLHSRLKNICIYINEHRHICSQFIHTYSIGVKNDLFIGNFNIFCLTNLFFFFILILKKNKIDIRINLEWQISLHNRTKCLLANWYVLILNHPFTP